MRSLSSKIEYKPITRISPSHFYAMVRCPYKIVLAEAFEKRSLMPLSPNAYIGSVVHKIMEKIAKRQLTEGTFNEVWENEIKLKEDELKQEGITYCIPLKSHVPNIGLKKILLKKQLKSSPKIFINKNQKIEFLSEKWLQNEDGTIAGMADLITKNFNSISISDFKTGKITYNMVNERGEMISLIKEEFEYQLKLYAQLYFINYGVYPNNLYIVDLNNNSTRIDFTFEECQRLYEQARDLLLEVNSNIHKRQFDTLANCSVSNCKYCLYRPACDFYHSWLPTNLSTNDILGELVELKRFLNGNVNATLYINGKLVSIIEIDPSFAVEKCNLGSIFGFYGLKRRSENSYSMNNFSCIYNVPQQ